MSRPGEKLNQKTIFIENKLKELDVKENSSKSLPANVLDMDDDFRPASTIPHNHVYPQVANPVNMMKNNTGIFR